MLIVNLDVSELSSLINTLGPAAKAVMKEHGQKLTANTRAYIVEQAHKRLHSRRAMFVKHLTHKQIDENTFVVSLAGAYRWIDDGIGPHNMIEKLLSSKKKGEDGKPVVKTSKDGSKYMAVPFEHGPQGPAEMTPAQATLLDTIKKELRKQPNKLTGKQGIPYAGIEKGGDGKPLLGKLHSFDIKDAPTKTVGNPWYATPQKGIGQGHGSPGDVMQGPTGIPLLQGVSIYQKEVENEETGQKKIKRMIMTFRIVSSKHMGQGRWDHPGLSKMNLMEDGYEWAKKTWEREVAPAIAADLAARL